MAEETKMKVKLRIFWVKFWLPRLTFHEGGRGLHPKRQNDVCRGKMMMMIVDDDDCR